MTTHHHSLLPMKESGVCIRRQLVQTVVEEGERGMELEHLTLYVWHEEWENEIKHHNIVSRARHSSSMGRSSCTRRTSGSRDYIMYTVFTC